MSTISVAVCAHHTRREAAEGLAQHLDATISMDDGTLGCIGNHDAALRLAARKPAEWIIVVEDDALPVPDFCEQAQAALAVCPSPFASLYYGYIGTPDERIRARLETHDPSWVLLQGFLVALCVAVRADYVNPLLAMAEEVEKELPDYPADHRWGEAAVRLGFWTPHAYPSLVDHADDRQSLVLGELPPEFERKAYKVGGREKWTPHLIRP